MVREAHRGSIGLPVEASSFSSHLDVLSWAGWRLPVCARRRHVPRHCQFYAIVASLPAWRISKWYFGRHKVLGMVHEHDNPRRVNLDWCEFHVLVHDLPIGKMTKDMAILLGNQLGRFKDVDMDNSMGLWGASMRIRVSLDITKPLRRVLKLKTTMGDELLVTFTYEKLPNFCYHCGRLQHLSEACEMQLYEDFVDTGNNTPFGAWLRAPYNASNRNRFQPSGQLTTGNNRGRPTFISNGCQHNPNGDLSPNQGPNAFGQPSSSRLRTTSTPPQDAPPPHKPPSYPLIALTSITNETHNHTTTNAPKRLATLTLEKENHNPPTLPIHSPTSHSQLIPPDPSHTRIPLDTLPNLDNIPLHFTATQPENSHKKPNTPSLKPTKKTPPSQRRIIAIPRKRKTS
ncbi:UNVERIFIED_CONTAM: hypothetical protein Slati_1712000 [Sesamum latifolium]|uniref:Zinc knuckle CX2CX4HX4C domain-containing protein n=1 Tax=Sesamum latifolium TaxID=2727402 RepID=A0AAW2X133_9LAMI